MSALWFGQLVNVTRRTFFVATSRGGRRTFVFTGTNVLPGSTTLLWDAGSSLRAFGYELRGLHSPTPSNGGRVNPFEVSNHYRRWPTRKHEWQRLEPVRVPSVGSGLATNKVRRSALGQVRTSKLIVARPDIRGQHHHLQWRWPPARLSSMLSPAVHPWRDAR